MTTAGIKEIALVVSKKEGVSISKAAKMVKAVIGAFEDVLVQEKKVVITGYFTAEVKLKKSRECRNPKTGEKITTAEKNVIKFKVSPAMENRVQ